MTETPVVTCFLRNRGAVLLLRRSDAVGSYSGAWGAVAGHADDFERVDAAARAEIAEETGLDDAVTLVRAGDPFTVADEDLGTRWVVHPFLFDCDRRDVQPNEETAEWEWTTPTAIRRRRTVPDLWTSYDRVRPTVETVAADTDHGAASISVRALEVLRDEAALAAEDADWGAVVDVAERLLAARPSMTVVENRVNRAMTAAAGAETPTAVEDAARQAIPRALDADDEAAALAADHVDGRAVATLSRSGTVSTALTDGDPKAVLVAESRPGGEGVWTAERLADAVADETDAPEVTLTTDAAFALELVAEGIGLVLVGADTILADGAVVNKVGTRMAATAAAAEGIPCYVVAASDKIAADHEVVVEERDPAEVYDGDAALSVANPTFDVTPADRIDGVLTERGELGPDDVAAIADDHQQFSAWRE
ncbi:NUDIX domain-containing protein [Haloarculaceae archaeon H-GB1-1]|nr:NUDIX domain-containing protein [Haloarculaceae archaeon H-GB1-1]